MAVSKSRGKDFSQIGYLKVTESGANTLTYAGLSVFSNVLGQKGMIINRAEYRVDTVELQKLVGAGDLIQFGLAGDDSKTSISLKDPDVYDMNEVGYLAFGTPGAAALYEMPVVKDWTALPGGGLLVPADRLFAYVSGNSLATAVAFQVRFWFDIIDLNAQDYLELAQAMRVLK